MLDRMMTDSYRKLKEEDQQRGVVTLDKWTRKRGREPEEEPDYYFTVNLLKQCSCSFSATAVLINL